MDSPLDGTSGDNQPVCLGIFEGGGEEQAVLRPFAENHIFVGFYNIFIRYGNHRKGISGRVVYLFIQPLADIAEGVCRKIACDARRIPAAFYPRGQVDEVEHGNAAFILPDDVGKGVYILPGTNMDRT